MKKFLSVLSIYLIGLTACKKDINPGQPTPEMNNKDINSSMVSAYASYRVIAGASGQSGFTNGNGNKARFNFPLGIWVNKDGSLLVSDMSNNAIRKLTSDTIVSTLNIPKTVDNESLSIP
ncbi:MAG: hypothetical protein JKY70_09810, partial [Mucilaginibacter sp.]|nr:hypothetical protein [Mucilaginibacter sp.]